MRPIDADALIEVVEKSMAENPHKEKTQRAMHIHEHKYFLTLLAGIPTIQTVATDTNVGDTISRQAAIDALDCINGTEEVLRSLPPAQSESCEYYALCRHGRDDNKLRVRLGFCEYCNEDVDGFVTPLEKNGHAFVRFGMNGWELSLKANGWHGSAKIRYCPMCGRDLYVK